MGHLDDGHYTLNLSDEEYELFEASTEEEQNGLKRVASLFWTCMTQIFMVIVK
jgi:hypothetical protein